MVILFDEYDNISLECLVCYDKIKKDNILVYLIGDTKYISPNLCGDCFIDWKDLGVNSIDKFNKSITNLNECVKSLKDLLHGNIGIPVNLSDKFIFPIPDEMGDIINTVDPIFGRKNEIAGLFLGLDMSKVLDHSIESAPQSKKGLRDLLSLLIEEIQINLYDYDEESHNEIMCLIHKLNTHLHQV